MSAWTGRFVDGKAAARRLLHLILESHNGRALAPIPEVTTSRHTFRFIRSGSLAMLAAMRRGSSCL